jgi:hypothetical protein
MQRRPLTNVDNDSRISKNREEQKKRDELLETRRPLFSKSAERRDRQAKITAKQTTQSLG